MRGLLLKSYFQKKEINLWDKIKKNCFKNFSSFPEDLFFDGDDGHGDGAEEV